MRPSFHGRSIHSCHSNHYQTHPIDRGCGIPDDDPPRIFDPYFTTKPGGSGLGLATEYTIIAKHGGNLSVQTQSGNGTVFIIDLPAAQQDSKVLQASFRLE
jgi:C4-dicarboxylate-specific signal transduction histidine kinase